ncbi:MAG: hypothetical protein KF773_26795 [Deltaproteobacteria bacterium]|nr:hypothetical protein [Deltaproteobacteria bacterium]
MIEQSTATRLDLLEQLEPRFKHRAAEDRRRACARLARDLIGLAGDQLAERLPALKSDERAALRDVDASGGEVTRLVRTCSSRAAREALVAALPWRAVAAAAWALTDASNVPMLVEVRSTVGPISLNARPLTPAQARALRYAGVRLNRGAFADSYKLPGLKLARDEPRMMSTAEWTIRCEADSRMPAWNAEGRLVARELSLDECRDHALGKYVAGWIGQHTTRGGPELPPWPTLPGDELGDTEAEDLGEPDGDDDGGE